LVDTPAGSRVIALTHRQAGKTSAAAVGLAHTMVWRRPGGTNLILCPTQRQSAELIHNLRGRLLDAGQKLAVDNAFSLALPGGSRCLGLPGADDAGIRGLSIDGDCVIDEAARVSDILYEAARPMLVRHTNTARLVLLSTAWTRSGFFHGIWTEGDPQDWVKIEARVDACRHISKQDLDREKRSMSRTAFAREYMNVFDSLESRAFSEDTIAAMFGGISGLSPPPPPPDSEDNPAISRGPAFASWGNAGRSPWRNL
jgi:hypothetical protein